MWNLCSKMVMMAMLLSTNLLTMDNYSSSCIHLAKQLAVTFLTEKVENFTLNEEVSSSTCSFSMSSSSSNVKAPANV